MTQIQLLREERERDLEPTDYPVSHQCHSGVESRTPFLSPPLPAWPSPDIPGSASFPGSHSPQPVRGELPQAKHMLLSSIALIHLQRGGIIAQVAMDSGAFVPHWLPSAWHTPFQSKAFSPTVCFYQPPSLSKWGRGPGNGKRKPDSGVQLHCVTGEGGNLWQLGAWAICGSLLPPQYINIVCQKWSFLIDTSLTDSPKEVWLVLHISCNIQFNRISKIWIYCGGEWKRREREREQKQRLNKSSGLDLPINLITQIESVREHHINSSFLRQKKWSANCFLVSKLLPRWEVTWTCSLWLKADFAFMS